MDDQGGGRVTGFSPSDRGGEERGVPGRQGVRCVFLAYIVQVHYAQGGEEM